MTEGRRPSETRARIEQAFARQPTAASPSDAEPESESGSTPPHVSAIPSSRRPKSYRLSADVSGDTYRWLRGWSAEHELRHVDVMRSLLAELQEDPVLMERVLRRLD